MTSVRKKQIKTLGILLVAVIALTVGFAAFSSSLNIKTRLSVNPNNGTFLVKFSNSSSTLDESDVTPTKSSDIFTAYDGEIDNSGIPTISNLGGQFTQPGEVITYDFYTLNTGSYNAYLTDVIFNNVDGTSSNKVCTSVDGTHQTEVDEACNGISIKVIMGIDTITSTRSMVGHTLESNASEPVRVVIEYAQGAVLPEVEFTVEFGTIGMIYNSLEEGGDSISQEENFTCYISTTQGEINGYLAYDSRCSKSVEITSDLKLPISEVTGTKFNYDKCVYSYTKVAKGLNPSYTDVQAQESAINLCAGIKEEDIEEFREDIEAYFDAVNTQSVNEEILSKYMMTLMLMDFEYSIIDENKYPVTKIGDFAFFANGLTNAIIPNIITNIGESSFGVNLLTSIEIPSSISEIPTRAFVENNITSLVLPNTITLIGENAFEDNLLTSINLPNSLVTIGSFAFRNNNIASLIIPNSVTSIGERAFAKNGLTNLTLGSGLTQIGKGSFADNNLTSIKIPDGLEEIGEAAFKYNRITEVEIGSGITNIGNDAFYLGSDNDYYSNITYGPNEITSVRIHINKNLNILGSNVFGWVSGKTNNDICWKDVCPS